MIEPSDNIGAQPSPKQAKDWVKILAHYREPSNRRSTIELAITAIPFVLFWGIAVYALSISNWLAFGSSLLIAPFLLRLFAIQHDCGHGSFFSNRMVSDWVGRCIGVLTLTPYDVWRRSHSIHHSSAGNLNRRGIGDILTLTVEEFSALTLFGRFKYRLYRNPVTMFGFGPSYLFLLENRLPLGFMNSARYWFSSMATNLAILLAVALIWYLGGAMPLLLIFLPSTLIAATAGVWLFYVQHQFEHTQWESEENWQLHESALHGSSHYVLPSVLQWISANIGIHHVHHLYSRIPFYRLPEVLHDHSELAQCNRMTIAQSLSTVKLKLWDADNKRLVSFSEARALHG
ncbi:fatty acid desaturase [Aliiruegeria lutimaris]|uniref:Omega-6 fatty acid desaturase (Delta-12 desaturase) n=1 Tax=Aliiruegeria lutimaris TaxID=571298 RepID=A0A1G8LLX2_9RHOB|nr:fatty acid desaturase [Aliiruegeria lutimaris]SDI56220.1 omega-6 fatty acid desaturase (delta-12 desaturase) [Aliiruegeria lutimaris]